MPSRNLTEPRLVDRPLAHHPRVELNLAKCALVTRQILLQNRRQRLSLLRTQINPLKIPQLNFVLALLLQRAEDKEEVPDVDAHLHAVRVGLAIILCDRKLNVRLRWIDHGSGSVAGRCTGGKEREYYGLKNVQAIELHTSILAKRVQSG